jgi:hypothetical protein
MINHRPRRRAACSITASLKIFMIMETHFWKLRGSTMVGAGGHLIMIFAGCVSGPDFFDAQYIGTPLAPFALLAPLAEAGAC